MLGRDSKTYFGFAIADSMFPDEAFIGKNSLDLVQARTLINHTPDLVVVCNPSHTATVEAMKSLGIKVKVPPQPPKVALEEGDKIIIMSVRGLPRLTDRREYTAADEVKGAEFKFSLYFLPLQAKI